MMQPVNEDDVRAAYDALAALPSLAEKAKALTMSVLQSHTKPTIAIGVVLCVISALSRYLTPIERDVVAQAMVDDAAALRGRMH